MSKLGDIIQEIDPSKRTIKKSEFYDIVKESLVSIDQINQAYEKLYEGEGEDPPILNDIETRLEKVRNKFEEYFITQGDDGKTKLSSLDEKITAIKNYHKEILEGENSINKSIDNLHTKIADFYAYLFEVGDVSEDPTIDAKDRVTNVKEAILKILEFDKRLNGDENSYNKKIEDAYAIITDKYKDLYGEDEGGESKISKIDKSIKKINDYNTNLNDVIVPFIEEVKKEIEIKKNDVEALLGGATGGSLVEGFLQSKNEYSQKPLYKKIEGKIVDKFLICIENVFIFFRCIFGILLDYVLFIFPLLILVVVFIRPDMAEKILNDGSDKMPLIGDYISGLNFWSRLIVSVPLWWISWFGQRNISHKKRLSEEYNHKAQVAKMYLNFTSRETESSYPITEGARQELDNVFIKAIKRHPGQVYGKDETMLDKLIQFAGAIHGNTIESDKKNDNESEKDLNSENN